MDRLKSTFPGGVDKDAGRCYNIPEDLPDRMGR